MKSFFLSAIFLICIVNGTAQRNKKLEKSIDKLLSAEFVSSTPGIVVLVAKGGNVVYEKAYGSANMELNVPLQPEMTFRVGSITKQFTAVAILKLVEQGLINLQDSVQRYIKDFPPKDNTITIEHLLTHTSGIPDYANADTVNVFIERENFTPERLISYFSGLPLSFAPGSQFSYSNSNYVILAYIIEKITRTGYHRYMEENIIRPLGLRHTYFANEHVIVPNRVAGYTRDRGFYENTEYQSISLGFGAGDMLSSAADLHRWHQALVSGKLIKKETLDKAFSPYVLNGGSKSNYGYGWFIDMVHDKKCIHHEGQVSGFIALEKYFPNEDVYIVILTNLKSGEDTTDFSSNRFQFFNTISSLAVGDAPLKEMSLAIDVLHRYAGTYALNEEHKIYISVENEKLYLECSNAADGCPKVRLYAASEKMFFVKVANFQVEFFPDEKNKIFKLTTRAANNNIIEWKKIN